jgi:hypothetical protein
MNEGQTTMHSNPIVGMCQAIITGVGGIALTELADGIGKPLIVLLTIVLLLIQIWKASKK